MSKFYPVAVPAFLGNEKKYVNNCIDSSWISSNGEYINLFENAFAEFNDSKYALTCCNGTVALHLALMAMGVKAGDEIIVPAFTYIATANAVRYCGAKPVFADCLSDTWNLDPADFERKITPRTKCVIPVHLYGNPCNMGAITDIAEKHNILILEDAAESHGATYNGKKVGSLSDIGIFSFFGNKIITTGEGGMIITNNDDYANLMKRLKGQGMDPNRRYWFNMIGYNYRMTNIEAAIGLAQLENIDEHIRRRKNIADIYIHELEEYQDYITFQKATRNAESVWWMFSLLLNEPAKLSRDELMLKLREDNIETRPLFYPMHVMPPYEDKTAQCPVSENIASRGVNLPTHGMLSENDIKYICEQLIKHIK
ncbi:MAG: DegT/DnrJ/EryC1/StrS family aminotransferase [Bacteroidales bacterium]|jgi:perosamine synthetase|nr:DegT/DnrJ/EryC1/StrS family aminotransferase [Bacteroidales bacterium]